VATDAGLEVTGVDELVSYFGEFADRVSEAVVTTMAAHGGQVISDAYTLAPKKTGAMASALSITPVQFPGGPGFTLSIGSNIVPYAYTYHSGIIGKAQFDPLGAPLAPKVSGGYMVFRVSGHNRGGYFVGGYSALRKITLNPYLFIAWVRLRAKLDYSVAKALEAVMR